MKRKSMKKVLAAILAASMLVMAGCGSGTGQTGTAEKAESDTTDTAASDSTGGYSEDEIITLKLFCDEVWWPYTDWSGRIPDIVTEKFGIKFEVTVPTDVNQLNMMIASGDLGDLVCSAL